VWTPGENNIFQMPNFYLQINIVQPETCERSESRWGEDLGDDKELEILEKSAHILIIYTRSIQSQAQAHESIIIHPILMNSLMNFLTVGDALLFNHLLLASTAQKVKKSIIILKKEKKKKGIPICREGCTINRGTENYTLLGKKSKIVATFVHIVIIHGVSGITGTIE
ncbi:hypothetical protein ACJX0J_026723, partial [Zea mays]